MRTRDTRGDEVIDSRDIIKRFDDLSDDLYTLQEAIKEAQETLDELDQNDADTREQWEAARDAVKEAEAALDDWDDRDEWQALKDLINEAEGYGDWAYGETLIADSYFSTYAQQLAEDIGAIDPNARWPMKCIDWEQAAEELKEDYTTVEFDRKTYWIRS